MLIQAGVLGLKWTKLLPCDTNESSWAKFPYFPLASKLVFNSLSLAFVVTMFLISFKTTFFPHWYDTPYHILNTA